MWGFPVWQRPRLHSIWNQISIGVPCGKSGRWMFKTSAKFFKSLDHALILGRMARARAHMRESKPLEKLSDVALVKPDAEPLADDALEVDPTPAHDAVDPGVRAGFNNRRQFRQLTRR